MANFKKLGEVTLAENASDSANVLIEESGEIKRVPKTEVGGSDTGRFTVTLTTTDGTNWTADKTFDEISSAYMNGKYIEVNIFGFYAQLVNVLQSDLTSIDSFIFSCTVPASDCTSILSIRIQVLSDVQWNVYTAKVDSTAGPFS